MIEQDESRMTFLMVSPVEYPNNPIKPEEEFIARLLITYPCPSNTPRKQLGSEQFPIGSNVLPARDKSELRNTVVPE